jgi:hypothetical protein
MGDGLICDLRFAIVTLLDFVIRHSSFVIRHSSIAIRQSPFAIRHSSCFTFLPEKKESLNNIQANKNPTAIK